MSTLPLVLLHGWGLNLRVFDPLAAELGDRHPVLRIDLPGHGRSLFDAAATTFEQQAEQLLAQIPERCILVGWSLGGQFALHLAHLVPERVRGLVLIASTPRFVASSDWSAGMKAPYLEAFATRLATGWQGVLEEFLAMQVRGGRDSARVLAELHTALRLHGLPDPRALAAGLGFLRDNDLRTLATNLALPVLLVSGQHDRVTPPAASAWLAQQLRRARHVDIPRAGHAPFLSHVDETAALIDTFATGLAA
jgi:pimeloyl-[acyl-carrier protein] methyl ester esterase